MISLSGGIDLEFLGSKETRNAFFYIYLILSLALLAGFIPVRWKADLEALDFAVTKDAEDYVVIDRDLPFIPPDSYVLPADLRGVDLEKLKRDIDAREAYIGIIEFYRDQEKVLEIVKTRRFQTKIFRVHTMRRGEYEKLKLDFDAVYMRFRRAVLERSVDLLWIQNLPDGYADEIEKKLKNIFKGHVVERPRPHPGIPMVTWPFSILLILLLASYKPILALVAGITMLVNYDIGISMGAILSTLAVYSRFRDPVALYLNFLILGLITNASLSDFNHLNQIEVFRGVKFSLVLLPGVVLLKGVLENREIFKNKRFLYILGIGTAIVGTYYVMRSGNFAPVSLYERKFRDILEKIFWIRPRFKDLIGYPMLFLSQRFNKSWNFVLETLGTVGLVSTFNTFCHVKSPIFVSLYRSFLGFALGFGLYLLIRALQNLGGETAWSGSPLGRSIRLSDRSRRTRRRS